MHYSERLDAQEQAQADRKRLLIFREPLFNSSSPNTILIFYVAPTPCFREYPHGKARKEVLRRLRSYKECWSRDGPTAPAVHQ